MCFTKKIKIVKYNLNKVPTQKLKKYLCSYLVFMSIKPTIGVLSWYKFVKRF